MICKKHPIPMITYRPKDNQILCVNQSAIDNYGYPEMEFLNLNLTDLHSFEEIIEIDDFLNGIKLQLPSSSESNKKEWKHITNNGDALYVKMSFSSEEFKGEAAIDVIIQDISKQKKLEKDLFEVNEIAKSSSKLKELFMANMSHEMRTPMNTIIGMSELLLETELKTMQHKYVDAVRTSANNLLQIINDILDFSKIENGKLELDVKSQNLRAVLDEICLKLHPKIESKELRLEKKIDDNIGNYLLDLRRFNQILNNLLGNALKFTNSGHVRISCILEDSTDQHDTLRFSVTDTGVGIDKNKLIKIFDSFNQAESYAQTSEGGTGLGLPISKQLVEMMGSELKVISKLGTGSEFYFTLKLEKTVELETVKGKQKLSNISVKGKKILLVEDNNVNRFIAQTVLENWGCYVDVAETGLIAVEQVKKYKYDLILMDILMPEMDGFDATRAIRNQLKSTVPIIALTANANKGDSEKCFSVGMNDYVSKPFKRNVLLGKIQLHLKLQVTAEFDESIALSDDTIDEKIQVLVDLSKLRHSTGDNQQFIQKMIQLFIDETPLQLINYSDALDSHDYPKVSSIAHKLKPSIDHLANSDMQNLVRKIENWEDPDIQMEEQSRLFSEKINELIIGLKGELL